MSADAEPAPPASRARRLVRAAGRKLLALGIGVAISFLFAECALRVIGIGSPVFHRPDDKYGMVLVPGADGWFTAEGKAWVSINADSLTFLREVPGETILVHAARAVHEPVRLPVGLVGGHLAGLAGTMDLVAQAGEVALPAQGPAFGLWRLADR